MEAFPDISERNYSYLFKFEKEFVLQDSLEWMQLNRTDCFYYIIFYICVIFGTKHYMQDKPRFNLRPLLIIWNFGLGAYSIIGFARTVPELIHILSNHGFYYSICAPSYFYIDRVSSFWTWLFVFSKIIELGDTVFIVLRKQPLIFLHWYHHIVTLFVTWYLYLDVPPTGRWYMIMNMFIHSIMYFYYALRAMGYHPSRKISMVITTLQITQMMIGCGINIYVYTLKNNNVACPMSYRTIQLTLIMYFSYFILFANFFYQTYISGKKNTRTHTKINNLHSSKTKLH